MPLQPGTIIGNKLRLVRVLAEGGMGTIWIADHLALNAQVAVKFIAGELATCPETVARFSREATSAAQLRHPHVIQVFDHGVTSDGVPYIVMELVDGEDLAERIEREGALEPDQAVRIVTQISRALAAAHVKGIIHRDIKPDNILLARYDGETFVKVLDFGIAKLQAGESRSVTAAGVAVGTPYYMSPEQALSPREVDHRADLWSLAVVAFHTLTGRRPFDGDTPAAVFVAINECAFLPPSSLVRNLSPALDRWFMKALSRKPENRFASAKELAETFEAAAAGKWTPLEVINNDLLPAREPVRALTAIAPTRKEPTLAGTATTGRTQPPSAASAKRVAMGGGILLLLVSGVVALIVAARHADSTGPDSAAAASAARVAAHADTPPSAASVDNAPDAVVPETSAASLAADELPTVPHGRPPAASAAQTASSPAATGSGPPKTSETAKAAPPPPPAPPKPPEATTKPPPQATKPAGEYYGF